MQKLTNNQSRFNHQPLHLFDITTSTTEIGRVYNTPSGVFPSVTTMLGHGNKQWLIDWKESVGEEFATLEAARAASRGTAVHLMAEHYLNNSDNPTDGHQLDHIKEFNSLRLHLNKIDNVKCQEAALWSTELRLAGRVDCIADFNGELSIIDFKTSTNDKTSAMITDYYLQVTAYAIMVQEMYGLKVSNYAIIMSSERGAVPLVFTGSIEDHISPLVYRLNKFYQDIQQ